jgi:hypothetical protein
MVHNVHVLQEKAVNNIANTKGKKEGKTTYA